MDYPRACAVATTLFALSGCAYSASAHWSLGGGWRPSGATMTELTRRQAAREEPRVASVRAQPERVATTPERRRTAARPENARVASQALPGRGGEDDADACYAALDGAGVSYQRVAGAEASGVDWPIQLKDSLGNVRIQGATKNAPTNYLDCRLARALLAWTPQLRAAGVVGLQHYSMYRQGAVVAGAGTVSGHAHGFAIDVASFELADGRRLRVLEDWTQRARGAEPCGTYADTQDGARMRELVCDAAEQSLFQLVLTPHYNDAHGNHVHLEVSESDAAPYVR